jgi:hypothetical protein
LKYINYGKYVNADIELVAKYFFWPNPAPTGRSEPPKWNIPINSSFRVGYLYGSQVVSTPTDPTGDPVQLDIVFGSPVLSGTIELSLIRPLTLQIIAELSVFGQRNIIYRSSWAPRSPAPDGLYSEARPGFVGAEIMPPYF